ncbi:type II toxin-antitoxin system RelE/ParE family toxin [Limnohabitans sp. JirII-31]|uniref:type II toxin-antitoxin system RelE/ParE family toxin n=1 Tax=Limnohabitans sp. JirII-31 TaxID=1977908 RepID=UPI000C1F0251|nr:plasmid stabilization system protein [Limnohabitans sp. JirII-31]
MINARFHSEARLEFLDGVTYYEAIELGLGNRFRQSVEAAVSLALSLPLAGSPYKHGTRRVFPKKFPFSIVYMVEENEIVIFAVAHFRRKPGYWKSRRHNT